jgi:hypothetical protein
MPKTGCSRLRKPCQGKTVKGRRCVDGVDEHCRYAASGTVYSKSKRSSSRRSPFAKSYSGSRGSFRRSLSKRRSSPSMLRLSPKKKRKSPKKRVSKGYKACPRLKRSGCYYRNKKAKRASFCRWNLPTKHCSAHKLIR